MIGLSDPLVFIVFPLAALAIVALTAAVALWRQRP